MNRWQSLTEVSDQMNVHLGEILKMAGNLKLSVQKHRLPGARNVDKCTEKLTSVSASL